MPQEEDPDILVDLTTARTAFEAEAIANALESRGIPARAFTLAGTMLQWDIAGTQPMRIQVRRRDLERARQALHDVRQDSIDIDWSEVDVGAPHDAADHAPPAPIRLAARCPACAAEMLAGPGRSRCPRCGTPLRIGPDGTVATRRTAGRFWRPLAIIAVGAAIAAAFTPLVIPAILIALALEFWLARRATRAER